jgi:hypothetical protein
MADPREKTHISVDRAILKQDRRDGTRSPALRLQRGADVQMTIEADVLGPSRVTYRPDAPPGGPQVWIETEAEVRPDAASVGAPVERRPAPRPQPLLSRVMQSTLLERAVAEVAARVGREPARADLVRRLGDLQRQSGDLAAALATYQRLLELVPSDATAGRIVAILEGRALAPAVWPEPVVLEQAFLPPDVLDQLLALTRAQRDTFAPTPVGGTANHYDPSKRYCTNTWTIEPVASRILPLIQNRLHLVLPRLGVPAQPLEIRDCKITCYGNGGFFGPHVDRGPGVEDRVLGFVLHFHFPPKRFRGGGLAVYDRDLRTGGPAISATTIVAHQNQLVLLGSDCWHEVLPVECAPDEWDAGRFTFNGWICRPSPKSSPPGS